MKVGAIIAEYNPFHNGHKYQIEKFRQDANLDYVIVIMSGNFTQRGEPAWMPKHYRAKMALLGGADLILELPIYYATGSAKRFAEGAIAHLNALGCVDELCFGCESELDFNELLKNLEQASSILMEEPDSYKEALNLFLRKGYSFPSAREKALTTIMDHADELFMPNNILALEYMIALKQSNSSISPRPLIRKGPGYHSLDVNEQFASASSIRHQLSENISPDHLQGLPEESLEVIKKCLNRNFPVTLNDFSLIAGYGYIQNQDHLTDYMDINEDIANRMHKCFDSYSKLDAYLLEMKNKSITHTRLSRCIIHLITGQTQERFFSDTKSGYAHYARILGFKKNASHLLSLLKQSSAIPMITKTAVYKDLLNNEGVSMFEADLYAAQLYRMVIQNKYGQHLKNEFNEQIVII